MALFLPMAIETVAALMACSKIGAIWVPIFSGFGPDAVATRIADARCEVVITANASLRKGAVVPMKPVADRAAEIAGGVRHQVVWMRLPEEPTPMTEGRDVAWPELEPQASRSRPSALDSEHPLFIGYTSGTTGTPKGAVHVHGGFLVKIAEEVAYQVDLHRGERLHWATDLGWIMGPWEIVGSLALGATVVLTEGSPLHPRSDRLMRAGGTSSHRRARRVADARARDARHRPLAPRRARSVVAAGARVDRGAMGSRFLPMAARGSRRGPPSDREPVGRHRGRGVLPVAAPGGADQGRIARRPGARHGRRHRRRRRARRSRPVPSASSSAASRGRR